ncbi:MAG: MerR family transcriptional regulator [Actinomycetota bacterium]
METETPHLSPAEMAEACDVTVDTLRYYEREGLLDTIERSPGGQRRYTAHDVAWVQLLRCLRVTALPIRDMRRFAELMRLGDVAIPERVELLQEHRRSVVQQMDELRAALTRIDEKLTTYGRILGTELVEPDDDRGA